MHQIWAETVRKKDFLLPSENLFWFSADILVQGQSNCIFWRNIFAKKIYNLLCGLNHNFWLFVRIKRKKLSKADISAFS